MENEQYVENDIMHIYEWVDSVQLSRPKKNIARDFSDGVLLAELVKFHIPKLVELHNYPAANSSIKKRNNWNTLNTKVFKKLGLQVSKKEIEEIVSCQHMAIENLLKKVYDKLQAYRPDFPAEENNVESPMKENNNKQFIISELLEGNSKDQFYRQQIEERDNVIEELKMALDETEMRLNKSDEDKQFLNSRLKELSEMMKKYGVI